MNGNIIGTSFTTSTQFTVGWSATNTYTAVIPYPGVYLVSYVSNGQTTNSGAYPRGIFCIILDPNGTLNQTTLISNNVSITSYTSGTQTLLITQVNTNIGGYSTISCTRLA